MPYYKLIVHGRGLDLHIADYPHLFGPVQFLEEVILAPTAIGFYTTRLILAKNKTDAISKIKSGVYDEWTEGRYAIANAAKDLTLELEEIEKISMMSGFFHSLPKIPLISRFITRFPTQGHSFYAQDIS